MRRHIPLLILLVVSGVFGIYLYRLPGPEEWYAPPEQRTLTEPMLQDLEALGERRARVRQRVSASATYLAAMLAENDSVLHRWPEHDDNPLSVWVGRCKVRGCTVELEYAVQNAFRRWQSVSGVPVAFRFVDKPGAAEVTVRWIERFDRDAAGETQVYRNREGWLEQANVHLATHSPDGRRLREEFVYVAALHEVGHVLGLGHSDDPQDLMHPYGGPESRSTHELSPRDRRTARLLYALPAGSVRAPRAGARGR